MSLTIDQQLEVLDYLHPNVSRIVINGELIWSDLNPAPMTLSEMEDAYPYVLLSSTVNRKLIEINRVREEKLCAGATHDFNGVIDTIQTREQDKFNLLAIAVKSLLMSNADMATYLSTLPGIGSTISFRAQSNTEYTMTPEESLMMAVKGYLYLEEIYKRSWVLKDLVENSNDVEFINSVHWDMEIP